MKLRTLCATALLATFVVGGMNASAAPLDPYSTTGTVEVIDGKVDPDGGLIDPEKPGEKIPEVPGVKPNPNTEMGPLEISHAPVLDFGEIGTSTKAVNQPAKATPLDTDRDGNPTGVTGVRGALLQFGDLRTKENGYTVSAALTKQFTQDTKTLAGSTITFTNPLMAKEDGATGDTPKVEGSFKLAESTDTTFGGAQTVASAKAIANEGKGMWAVEYGVSAEKDAANPTADKSVFLDVPANTASSMAGGTYVAEITWTISATPGI